MKIELEAYDAEEDRLLWARWENGRAHFQTDNPWMRKSIERWETLGLLEWVGVQHDPQQRLTRTEDAEFLPRLSEYLKAQGGFAVRLKSDRELDFAALREMMRFRQRLHQQAPSNDAQRSDRDISPVRLPGQSPQSAA